MHSVALTKTDNGQLICVYYRTYFTCALLMWSIHSVATVGELALRMNQVEATWNSLSTTAQKEPNRKTVNNSFRTVPHYGKITKAINII